MKTIKFLAIAALAMSGCGDNKAAPDARVKDSSMPDTLEPIPAAPTIGAQIDRMGRAAVNTALNHGFDTTAATLTDKKAYNEKSTLADWTALPVLGEFISNLAIIDVLDTGICGNKRCELGEADVAGGGNIACPGDCATTGQIGTGNGCGNQAMYNGTGMGNPSSNPNSYGPLAGLLAVDHLYLDSSKSTCQFYLAVEFGVVTGGGNSTCGGRAPQYDVVDFSFSMLASGLAGFNTQLQPQVNDGVAAHTDYLADFPYLGAPH